MSWRQIVVERDLSGFTTLNANETGAIVLRSKKGPNIPLYIQSEQDVLTYYGYPSADYNEVFELIDFTRSAPCWAISPIGSGALYGGIDVLTTEVVGFGVGRDFDSYDYSVIARAGTKNVGTGDGYVATFSGTLTDLPVINTDNVEIIVNGSDSGIVCSAGGVLSGTALTSGSLNLTTGVYTMTFTGTPGAYATVTTNVDFSSTVDFSSGGTSKYVNITVDGVTSTVNLGSSATTSKTDVINAINAAFGITVAASSGNFIAITGKRASTTGNVTIAAPTTGDSALVLAFSAGGTTLTNTGTAPTGYIPLYGQTITLNYNYSVVNTNISHSFFTIAPYADDLGAYVLSNGGQKFTLYLYQKNQAGGWVSINTYAYSLIRELDGFKRSLYYDDVFDGNPYVQVKLNPNYIADTYAITSTTKVAFSGGNRGADPAVSDYRTAWTNFYKANKYPAQIFMDVAGNNAALVNTICDSDGNYQPWAQGITCLGMGNDATEAITARSVLGLDSDNIALYTNWGKIQDDYNNSVAWISSVGSIGRKYALMADTYDAASPAGIDENNHGGQLSGWTYLEMENDYTENELQLLDEAQINPFIKDDTYGVFAYGDRTLQVTNSDTSFIGTRRVYKLIIDKIKRQVMKLQEFKNNDPLHRLMARTKVISIMNPILAAGWLREFTVICDATNNTDAVMDQRKFVIDVYVKITPNSQTVQLNFTRLSQTQTVATVIG